MPSITPLFTTKLPLSILLHFPTLLLHLLVLLLHLLILLHLPILLIGIASLTSLTGLVLLASFAGLAFAALRFFVARGHVDAVVFLDPVPDFIRDIIFLGLLLFLGLLTLALLVEEIFGFKVRVVPTKHHRTDGRLRQALFPRGSGVNHRGPDEEEAIITEFTVNGVVEKHVI